MATHLHPRRDGRIEGDESRRQTGGDAHREDTPERGGSRKLRCRCRRGSRGGETKARRSAEDVGAEAHEQRRQQLPAYDAPSVGSAVVRRPATPDARDWRFEGRTARTASRHELLTRMVQSRWASTVANVKDFKRSSRRSKPASARSARFSFNVRGRSTFSIASRF